MSTKNDPTSIANTRSSVAPFDPSQGPQCVFKGNLIKKNWYNSKQLRFFELYNTGELKYYKDMKDYKGSITLDGTSKIFKVAKTTLEIFCIKK